MHMYTQMNTYTSTDLHAYVQMRRSNSNSQLIWKGSVSCVWSRPYENVSVWMSSKQDVCENVTNACANNLNVRMV